MQNERPPLYGASDTVWKDLDQLLKQVKDLCGATSGGIGNTGNAGNAGEEGESLQHLLLKIENVPNLRVTRPEGPSHGGHTEERPSGAVPRIDVDEGSASSTPTTETSEGENVFERPCDFIY